MKIRFWGVRGSIPSPLLPSKIRSKISSAVERIGPDDIKSQDARELFLSRLPEYLFSTVGGNTACVEIVSSEKAKLIFDAGTGIRELGNQIAASREAVDCHIFFTHFHWDHIQGLPFFSPAFDKRNSIHYYSPVPELKQILEAQMREPYFPVTMDAMAAKKEWCILKGEPVHIGGVEIRYRPMNHPGGCYSYLISEGGKKVLYATDTELTEADFEKNEQNAAYFQGVDTVISDTQYTLGEAIEKYNWGHSSFSLAADFASTWGIKRFVLFHHEPLNSDSKIESLYKNAVWYAEHLAGQGIEVMLAREGLEIEV